jgi:hypothetical protein
MLTVLAIGSKYQVSFRSIAEVTLSGALYSPALYFSTSINSPALYTLIVKKKKKV